MNISRCESGFIGARGIEWNSEGELEGAINIYIECTRTLFKLVRTEREIRTRFATFDKLTRTSASDF